MVTNLLNKLLKNFQSFLFAAFVGIVIASSLIFLMVAAPRIKAANINQVGQELYKQISLVEADFTTYLRWQTWPSVIQKKAQEIARLSKSRVTIIDKSGKVIADSSTPFSKIKNLESHSNRPEIIKAKKSTVGSAARYSATLDKNLVYSAKALRDQQGKLLGFIRLAVPATYVAEISSRTNKAMGIALILAIITAIIISSYLARYFSKPIVRLVDVTRRIAAGDFPQTILQKSNFELGELETAVEQMSRKLSNAFKKISSERSQIVAVLSSMSEAVLAVDIHSKVIFANPVMEKMFCIIEPEVSGKSAREAIRNNEIADLLDQALKTESLKEAEISVRRTDGEDIFIAHASPIKNESGALLGAVSVLYDITEIRKLEKHRSEFVANVSHELKTPLTAIRNYVETLLDGAIEDPENNKNFLAKIEKHAINLSSLIDDILEVSKLETKRDIAPFATLNVIALIDRAMETVAQKAEAKNIHLRKKTLSDTCYLSGIEDHVYRTILNLLDNAINYTDANGTVEIACVSKNNNVEISVQDNGLGIAPEHLNRIFERFYRVDKARSRDLGGTGLGLAIVKHVMNIHNGRVLVESEVGKGSRVTLVFPA
ncbi:hypothetical protein COT42_04295 [Candidatus Saganbacteria bacterium CG08_land_8_20_14_0_20_45_16]|uniref:histidine kinase n=1 Tax=Candidatus Saganbacteria bacterium CG08_land_8_20_14_0_20_45_16 TaxID=2014293 RepID=A0A2H0Y0A4_UNCSA|nr:MAG: hypothetical protein COT42_04295 [Candidatus Saganbacteria bacterium CG08_land_8_20_14_0_20_45_16]